MQEGSPDTRDFSGGISLISGCFSSTLLSFSGDLFGKFSVASLESLSVVLSPLRALDFSSFSFMFSLLVLSKLWESIVRGSN